MQSLFALRVLFGDTQGRRRWLLWTQGKQRQREFSTVDSEHKGGRVCERTSFEIQANRPHRSAALIAIVEYSLGCCGYISSLLTQCAHVRCSLFPQPSRHERARWVGGWSRATCRRADETWINTATGATAAPRPKWMCVAGWAFCIYVWRASPLYLLETPHTLAYILNLFLTWAVSISKRWLG